MNYLRGLILGMFFVLTITPAFCASSRDVASRPGVVSVMESDDIHTPESTNVTNRAAVNSARSQSNTRNTSASRTGNTARRESATTKRETTNRTTQSRTTNAGARATQSRTARTASSRTPTVTARSASTQVRSASNTRAARSATNAIGTSQGATKNAVKSRTATAGKSRAASNTITRARTTSATALINSDVSGMMEYCKTQYTQCMDNFCDVLDDAQGRCSCSKNIKNYAKTSTAQKEANAALQDIAQQIQYIGLSRDEVEILFTQTEAELTMQGNTDNSQIKNSLDKIKEMIVDVKPGTAVSTETDSDFSFNLDGLLDFNLDSMGFDLASIFGNNNSGTSSISNQRGEQLYKTASARCKKSVLESCQAQGINITLIENSYDLEIDRACIAYERSLSDGNDDIVQTVRNAQAVLQRARLMVEQQKNVYDLRGCVGALDACMQDDFVCGSDYELCLDPTGKYIVEGEVVVGSTPGYVIEGASSVPPSKEYGNNTLMGTWYYDGKFAWGATTQDGSLMDYISKYVTPNPIRNTSSNMAEFLQHKIGYNEKGKNYGMCMSVLNKCQNLTYDKKTGNYIPNNQVITEYLARTLVQIKRAQDAVLADYAESCITDVSSCLSTNNFDTTASNSKQNIAINACRSQIKTCMSVNGNSASEPDPADLRNWVMAMMGALLDEDIPSGGNSGGSTGGNSGTQPGQSSTPTNNPYTQTNPKSPMLIQAHLTDVSTGAQIAVYEDTQTNACYANPANTSNVNDACVVKCDISSATSGICNPSNTVTLTVDNASAVSTYALRSGVSLTFNGLNTSSIKIALENGQLPSSLGWVRDLSNNTNYRFDGIVGPDGTEYYDKNGNRVRTGITAGTTLTAVYAYDGYKQACVDSGGTWQNESCSCTATGTIYDEETAACMCNVAENFTGTPTMMGCQCADGFEFANGTCRQKESGGTTPDQPEQPSPEQTACTNAGGTWNGTTCDCGAGKEWNGTACVSTGGTTPDQPEPDLPSTEQTACTNTGGTWNGTTCECGAGKEWNGTACVSTGGESGGESGGNDPEQPTPEQTACTNTGGRWDGTGCSCTNITGATVDATLGKCICDSSQGYTGSVPNCRQMTLAEQCHTALHADCENIPGCAISRMDKSPGLYLECVVKEDFKQNCISSGGRYSEEPFGCDCSQVDVNGDGIFDSVVRNYETGACEQEGFEDWCTSINAADTTQEPGALSDDGVCTFVNTNQTVEGLDRGIKYAVWLISNTDSAKNQCVVNGGVVHQHSQQYADYYNPMTMCACPDNLNKVGHSLAERDENGACKCQPSFTRDTAKAPYNCVCPSGYTSNHYVDFADKVVADTYPNMTADGLRKKFIGNANMQLNMFVGDLWQISPQKLLYNKNGQPIKVPCALVETKYYPGGEHAYWECNHTCVPTNTLKDICEATYGSWDSQTNSCSCNASAGLVLYKGMAPHCICRTGLSRDPTTFIDNSYDPNTGSCACQDGYTKWVFGDGTAQCVPVGSVCDDETRACRCDADRNFTLGGTTDSAPDDEGFIYSTSLLNSPPSYTFYCRCKYGYDEMGLGADGKMACWSGYEPNKPSAEQTACINAGGTWTGATCNCGSGKEWNSTNCVASGGESGNEPDVPTQPSAEQTACTNAGGTWNGTTCECAYGYSWDSNNATCVSLCAANETPMEVNDTIYCVVVDDPEPNDSTVSNSITVLNTDAGRSYVSMLLKDNISGACYYALSGSYNPSGANDEYARSYTTTENGRTVRHMTPKYNVGITLDANGKRYAPNVKNIACTDPWKTSPTLTTKMYLLAFKKNSDGTYSNTTENLPKLTYNGQAVDYVNVGNNPSEMHWASQIAMTQKKPYKYKGIYGKDYYFYDEWVSRYYNKEWANHTQTIGVNTKEMYLQFLYSDNYASCQASNGRICLYKTDSASNIEKLTCDWPNIGNTAPGTWLYFEQDICKCQNGSADINKWSCTASSPEQTACTNAGGTWNGTTCDCGDGYQWQDQMCKSHAQAGCEATGGNWGGGQCSCDAGKVLLEDSFGIQSSDTEDIYLEYYGGNVEDMAAHNNTVIDIPVVARSPFYAKQLGRNVTLGDWFLRDKNDQVVMMSCDLFRWDDADKHYHCRSMCMETQELQNICQMSGGQWNGDECTQCSGQGRIPSVINNFFIHGRKMSLCSCNVEYMWEADPNKSNSCRCPTYVSRLTGTSGVQLQPMTAEDMYSGLDWDADETVVWDGVDKCVLPGTLIVHADPAEANKFHADYYWACDVKHGFEEGTSPLHGNTLAPSGYGYYSDMYDVLLNWRDMNSNNVQELDPACQCKAGLTQVYDAVKQKHICVTDENVYRNCGYDNYDFTNQVCKSQE